MFRTKYQLPGTPPATLTSPDEEAEAPTISLIEYDRTHFAERKIEDIEEVFGCIHNDKTSWINIDGLGDVEMLRKLGSQFGLHPLALEDVLVTSQRPKLEEFPNHYFIVCRMIYADDDNLVCSEQVSIFLGKSFVITIQEESKKDVFDSLRQRLRNGRGFARSMKSDYLGYAIIDSIMDQYFPVLESLGEALESLEDMMMEKPSRESLLMLHEYKRTLLQLRRSAWAEREMLAALGRDESGMVDPQTKPFLRDCYDHAVQIIDIIENYRDVNSDLMDMYLSSVSMKTNDVMRTLTVISAIFSPLTFIVGIYGMNFDTQKPGNMPELGMPYGYVVCLSVMAMIAIAQLIYFTKKGWLKRY